MSNVNINAFSLPEAGAAKTDMVLARNLCFVLCDLVWGYHSVE